MLERLVTNFQIPSKTKLNAANFSHFAQQIFTQSEQNNNTGIFTAIGAESYQWCWFLGECSHLVLGRVAMDGVWVCHTENHVKHSQLPALVCSNVFLGLSRGLGTHCVSGPWGQRRRNCAFRMMQGLQWLGGRTQRLIISTQRPLRHSTVAHCCTQDVSITNSPQSQLTADRIIQLPQQ